jgi:hypothetical protein
MVLLPVDDKAANRERGHTGHFELAQLAAKVKEVDRSSRKTTTRTDSRALCDQGLIVV